VGKQKKAQPWESVYDSIRVIREVNYRYVAPTDSDLDEVERQVGSRLPESYRAFVKRFGAGELLGWVRLTDVAPRRRKRDSTVTSRTLELREFWKREQWTANHEWLSGLVYFADSAGGDEYAWDPADVTQSEPHECRFYFLPRLDEDHPVAAGASFTDFIKWLDADVRADPDYDQFGLRGLQFQRYYEARKKRPKPADVKLWLTFNNNTARDLALSIRDRGQTDAFPILADALQEAGCTNADLLDSCRTGDPDIDGQWVHQVLLGRAAK
jgi:hypothetical protein